MSKTTTDEDILRAASDADGLEQEFTVDEAAQYLAALGITDDPPHVETVRRWLREGRMQGYKISARGQGGSWRIPLANLLAFDPGNKKGSQGRPTSNY